MAVGPTGPTEAIPVIVVPLTGEVIDLRDLDACRAAVLDVRRMIDELVEVRRDLSAHIAITERRLDREERDRLLARIAELERSFPDTRTDETREGGTG